MTTAAKRLAEVRRRVIVDYYTGTSPDSPHWQVCRLCSWVWRWEGKETHDIGCPMEKP